MNVSASLCCTLKWMQHRKSTISSVAQSCLTLQPHGLQHSRPPCPSPTPGVPPNPCPSSWWCHPAISSSVIPFSSCPQSLPASRSFPLSQLFAWGGQSTGVSASASVLPTNIQDWFPLEWTGLISLLSKGLSKSSPAPQFKCTKRIQHCKSTIRQWKTTPTWGKFLKRGGSYKIFKWSRKYGWKSSVFSHWKF